MSSYKLNKMFCICKLGPLLFEYSLLRLQLYLGFIFSLSLNPLFLFCMFLSIFYSLWWHLSYRFVAQFQKSSRYCYLFFIYYVITYCHNALLSFPVFAPGKCHTINLFSYRIPPTCLFNNRVSNEHIHFFYCDRFFDFLSVD